MVATRARRRAELIAEKTLEAEAVRRSDAMKTAVLHAVSHDLRSPLIRRRNAKPSRSHRRGATFKCGPVPAVL